MPHNNKPATKKGSSGILRRTKEPKLATVNPTEKAKIKRITSRIRVTGFFLSKQRNQLISKRIKRKIVRINKYVFSKEETSITIFLTSQMAGLKMPENIAIGALEATPLALASKFPIQNFFHDNILLSYLAVLLLPDLILIYFIQS